MTDLVITTFDWLPEFPRGFVRDIRLRWALEEAKLPYRVETVPFKNRSDDHFARQPFGQVPWLTEGDITIFESGAAILYLAQEHAVLMPNDNKEQANVMQWVFAALNSVEAAALPWFIFAFSGLPRDTDEFKRLDKFLQMRLDHMETVLSKQAWLTQEFSVADILMADVLRTIDRFDALEKHGTCRAYVERATARPAFKKAYADQIAHFSKLD